MKIRQATVLDEEAWNRFVAQQADATPYHHFAWKQCIEEAYGMKSYHLIAEDNEGQIRGILPLTMISRPLFSDTLCSLPYCDRGEALTDSPEIEELLLQHALTLGQTLGARHYEYRGQQSADIQNESELFDQKIRMVLALPNTSDALFKGFKAKLRSQINKAKKNGLSVELGNSETQLRAFYSVFVRNMRDLGSPTHSQHWFRAILKHFGDQCVVSTILHEGQAIGGGLILIQGKTAFIPWASTLREFNHLSSNMLLYWSLLEYASDHGCSAFDFGRSTYGEGTYKFKKQWGAEPIPLKWTTFDLASGQVEQANANAQSGKTRKQVEAVWRKIPLPMTVELGSFVRKYISL